MVMKQREEIRNRYAIKGSSCGDCCATYWCIACTMMQQDNEVKRREAARLATNPNTQGYQAPAGMMVPEKQPEHPQEPHQIQYQQPAQQQYPAQIQQQHPAQMQYQAPPQQQYQQHQ